MTSTLQANPVLKEAIREIRLNLAKAATKKLTDAGIKKKVPKSSPQYGFTLDEAIGHLKSFTQEKNPEKALFLNAKCNLSLEQYP